MAYLKTTKVVMAYSQLTQIANVSTVLIRDLDVQGEKNPVVLI
jgi:hypothetical protein